MIVILVGESASGKTTLAKTLEERVGFERVITYTTRPMREGERNGVDYNFISKEEFDELVRDNFFTEHIYYRGWGYGTAIDVDLRQDQVVVLNPPGVRSLKKSLAYWSYNIYECTVVYLNVDRRSRLIKLLERGDDIEESYRRSLSDVGQFSGFENEADFVIDNPNYDKSVNEVYGELFDYIKKIKEENFVVQEVFE